MPWTMTKLIVSKISAICKSRDGKLRDGMRGMIGTWRIKVQTGGIRWERGESRWECREWKEWGESRWKCRNQGGNVGNQSGNAGNQSGNAGNGGGNEGNQGNSSWKFSSLLLQLKSWSARGEFYHPAFVVSRPTVSHTFYAFSIKWMNSPLRKWGREVSPRSHLLVFVFGVNQEYYDAGVDQDSPVQPQWWKPSPQTKSHLEFRQTSTNELPLKNS